MDALIVLIILGAFIRGAVRKSERQKGKKTVGQSVPNQRRQPDRPVQRKTSASPDILSRAKENVQENEADMIQQEVHEQVCSEYRDMSHKKPDVQIHKRQSINCDDEEESDMMKRVNDLIVTGYSGEMNFDRDFVAEGIEMLNRFSL